MARLAFTWTCLAFLGGCVAQGRQVHVAHVSQTLEECSGHVVQRQPLGCRDSVLPHWDPTDGFTQDEAVTLALWNNAAFQELLTDLGIARADLIEAGQLTNPELWAVFPVGVKQLEFALNVPLEALLLRRARIATAELESQRIGQRIVQSGLNLVRDVRLAYADLLLVQNRLELARQGGQLRTNIARLGEARLRSGDASELRLFRNGLSACSAMRKSRDWVSMLIRHGSGY